MWMALFGGIKRSSHHNGQQEELLKPYLVLSEIYQENLETRFLELLPIQAQTPESREKVS